MRVPDCAIVKRLLDALGIKEVLVGLWVRELVNGQASTHSRQEKQAFVDHVQGIELEHDKGGQHLSRHHLVGQYKFTDKKLTGCVCPIRSPNHINVKEAECQSQYMEPNEGSNVSIAKALIIEC